MKSPTRLVVLLCVILLCGCYSTEKVPQTGRTRTQLRYTESEMEGLGAQAYREATQKYKIITGTPEAARCRRAAPLISSSRAPCIMW